MQRALAQGWERGDYRMHVEHVAGTALGFMLKFCIGVRGQRKFQVRNYRATADS
jgi:hypothetical protein